ncbi:hypothetical protein M2171_001625 [Bradyrhizobium japonicum USDA 38]|nr:hypothetical protein [Bradyrhizobium japonicum]MCS3892492.1 hypothetical protein [Bradyrhizobium japonicum USDA 38]MCS3945006.1 hypothetical protein [Bradyrhizobium japonicum]
MPILGNAGAGHDRSRQDIAFENDDFLEGGRKRTGGRQSSNPRSDDNRALPEMTAHIHSFVVRFTASLCVGRTTEVFPIAGYLFRLQRRGRDARFKEKRTAPWRGSIVGQESSGG